VHTRSLTGFHPFLAKAAFPTLGINYRKDWEDYHSMQVPFILERVVIADRGAADRSGKTPAFSSPFEDLHASKYWLEPIRRALVAYLDVPQDGKKKRVMTYLSRQGLTGPRLKNADHEALVKELNKLGRRHGYEVVILSEKVSWDQRMTAIVQSTVSAAMLGSTTSLK
jgi:hypothetical protein